MITIELHISDELIQKCKDELSGWYGIVATDKHIEKVLNKKPTFAAELYKYGSIDTVMREDLIDTFVKSVLNIHMEWPMAGSSQKYKSEFYTQFLKRCDDENVELHWTDEDRTKALLNP